MILWFECQKLRTKKRTGGRRSSETWERACSRYQQEKRLCLNLHTTPLGAVRGMRSAQQKHERSSTVRPIVRLLPSLIATITNDYDYNAVSICIFFFRQICMDLSKQCWLIFLGNLSAHCSLTISPPESEKIIRLVSFNTKINLK